MTPEQVEAHDKPVALLRPPAVHERTTISGSRRWRRCCSWRRSSREFCDREPGCKAVTTAGRVGVSPGAAFCIVGRIRQG